MKKTILALVIASIAAPVWAANTPTYSNPLPPSIPDPAHRTWMGITTSEIVDHEQQLNQLQSENLSQGTDITNLKTSVSQADTDAKQASTDAKMASVAAAAADSKAANALAGTASNGKVIGTMGIQVGKNQTEISTLKMQVNDPASGLASKVNQAAVDTAISNEVKRADAAYATKTDVSALQQFQTSQVTLNSAISKTTQRLQTNIDANKQNIDANKQGVADNKAAIAGKVDQTVYDAGQAAQDKLIAGKVDTATYTKEQGIQDQKIADAAAQIAVNKTNITTVNDKAIAAQKDATAAKTTADQGVKDAAAAKTIADANTQALKGKVDQTAYDQDQDAVAQAIRDANANITQNHLNIHHNETAIQANTDALKDKVNTTDFTADQGRQDKAQKDEHDRALAAENNLKQTKADKAELDPLKTNISNNQGHIATLQATVGTLATTSSVSTLQQRVTDDETTQHQTDDSQNQHITDNSTGVATNKAGVAANKQALTTKADAATEQQHFTTLTNGLAQKVDNSVFQQRAQDLDARITQNKADQAKVNKAMSDRLDNHEDRIQDLEKRSNQNFADLDKKIDANRHKANAGTANALAATGIPQVMADQTFAVGAATGGYEGEQALAVGFSARASQNVTVKASVGTDSQHGFGYAAGFTVGW